MAVQVIRIFLLFLLLTVSAGAVVGTQPVERTAGWRLAAESSPYLRLHADNPVEWFPWGEAAFAKARRENKPLFISIGYFTCHWCHVMARESFSNPEIARQLNDGFIAIKIDREQRPDLDAAYMQYVTLTRGHGGWPMSVWATPEGEPFVGATYIPPDETRGRPGMKQLLARLSRLWKDDEAGLRATAASAVKTLQKLGGSAQPVTELTTAPLVEARRQYASTFDELQGGFGMAPKFPQPARLMFLLQDESQASADMALFTLDTMLAGGIYDQLGGGFHRYSTDFEWRVPHFEKMLYDQALIARAYLYAYRRTANELYADTARATLDFTLREMRDPQGGFHAALSADSPVPGATHEHMEEGAFYTWNWRQLVEAISDASLRDWVVARYGLSELGNAVSDPLNEMSSKNVLYRAMDTRELAQTFNVDLMTAARRNLEGERLLRAARDRRPAVPVDDKVVAVWNGYMMTTLALAGRVLDEPRYIEAAGQTAEFVLNTLFDEKDALLYRDWRDGERGVPGFSEDYAAVAEGLLALYKVTGNKRRLNAAQTLVDLQLEMFWDRGNGGFFSTPATTELWVREKPVSDGATLALNGIALHVLLQLGELTGKQSYLQYAWQTAAWAAAQMHDAGAAMPYSLIVWNDLVGLNPVKADAPVHSR
jgi:uncharacterized protein YyaL (SSP411 family)